ncbi:SHC-transforming protein 1 [Metopolophium dirhodum]|uniref:SHC-transforming protein 1 n=1 Tax=Metopolophium dirhodum TaxID=44670 RepID=UPI00299032F0|nr:SHC-transforming protein 1 [Metopolophium dirhodum]
MPDSWGSFMNKPARGWLHPDNVITRSSVCYEVRYIGCLEVLTSMKSLDFDTRFLVAKECINKVCEAAGLKTADKKRKVDKKIIRLIGDHSIMDHAGSNVTLSISSTCLTLKLRDSHVVISTHDMPRISFASGGDADTIDFVAFVAKDIKDWRACYVLECGEGELAQDVITTIGQAFDLRFKQFLTKPAPVLSSSTRDEREYYNDLPGKSPPETGPPPVPPLPSYHDHRNRERLVSNNLIDLNCEAPPPPVPHPAHNYVNDFVVGNKNHNSQPRDVFDMQPFVDHEPLPVMVPKLQDEIWFHGSITRQHAEALLKHDGDFLVRESQGSPGQYVLTGLQGDVKKHLLLIDPEGAVRTKDRMFESVSHLVNYHSENKLPIMSAESALILRYPVPRTRF